VAWSSTLASFWLKIDLNGWRVWKSRYFFCFIWFSLFFLTALHIRLVNIELVEVLRCWIFLFLFSLRIILKTIFLILNIATNTLRHSLRPLVSEHIRLIRLALIICWWTLEIVLILAGLGYFKWYKVWSWLSHYADWRNFLFRRKFHLRCLLVIRRSFI